MNKEIVRRIVFEWIAGFLYGVFEFFSLNLAATHKVTLALDYRQRWRDFLPPQKVSIDQKALWIHGASVGELEDLAAFFTRPDLLERAGYGLDQIILTSSSPSAENFLEKLKERFSFRYAGPLPPDRPGPVNQFISQLHPELLILSQSDVWPVMLACGARRIARGAIWLPHKSTSARRLRKYLLEPLVRTVGMRSQNDPNPLPEIPAEFIGSPRVDRILDRIDREREKIAGTKHTPPVKVLLASAWKEDGMVWAEALQLLGNQQSNFSVECIPHDIHSGIEVSTLSSLFGNRVKIEEGKLLESYGRFDLAYVGGGFHTGLHNIVEPLAWGLPTICGPDLSHQPEAPALVRSSALTAVKDARALAQFLRSWLQDEDFRNHKNTAALAAQTFLYAQRGATERLVKLIAKI